MCACEVNETCAPNRFFHVFRTVDGHRYRPRDSDSEKSRSFGGRPSNIIRSVRLGRIASAERRPRATLGHRISITVDALRIKSVVPIRSKVNAMVSGRAVVPSRAVTISRGAHSIHCVSGVHGIVDIHGVESKKGGVAGTAGEYSHNGMAGQRLKANFEKRFAHFQEASKVRDKAGEEVLEISEVGVAHGRHEEVSIGPFMFRTEQCDAKNKYALPGTSGSRLDGWVCALTVADWSWYAASIDSSLDPTPYCQNVWLRYPITVAEVITSALRSNPKCAGLAPKVVSPSELKYHQPIFCLIKRHRLWGLQVYWLHRAVSRGDPQSLVLACRNRGAGFCSGPSAEIVAKPVASGTVR
jgi:hypothetical protein